MAIALFFGVLVLSIVIHEAGHFWTARRFGMKAERFFVGFGPTLWSTQRGETEVGLKAIPAGGFVKITGMSRSEAVDPADEPRAFYNQPPYQRAIVLVAGVVTHFVLAALLIWGGLTFSELPRFDGMQPVVSAAVGSVEEGTAAEAAGLEPGDELLTIAGRDATDPEAAVEAIASRPGETIEIAVLRDGEEEVLTATLPETGPDGEERGFLGVAIAGLPQFVSYGPGEAVVATFVGDASIFAQANAFIRGLGQALSPESLSAWLQQADGQTPRSDAGPISVVGIGQAVGALGDADAWSGVLLLMIQIQIVVGFLNIIPLPPFDGGHLAQLAVESTVNGVRRLLGKTPDWELSPAVVTPLALAVLLLVVGFAATAIYIDIVNPVSGLFE